MVNPDFALVAQAMGFRGITVRQPADLHGALTQAFAEEGPVLIDVFTNPASLAMPPKIEWNQLKGYTLAMSKLILGGRMDDVLDTVKANYKHLSEVL